MKTLILPANGRYSDILQMISDSQLEVKILRDALIEHPEFVDESNHQFIGKEAIATEIEDLTGTTASDYIVFPHETVQRSRA